MQKITPMLWFDTQAEEAAKFYTAIFKDSKITEVSRYPEGSPYPAGSVMTASFTLNGQEFIALNAGPTFKFTEAISWVVNCENQEEVDYYWDKLMEGGGKPSMCGWLKDKFGMSWQVTPTIMSKLMTGDKEKSQRVMKQMMTMVKLDIQPLQDAYDGKTA